MSNSSCFYSYQNLTKAFEFKLTEFEKSNFSLDPLYSPLIKSINSNKEFIFSSLENYLKSGIYTIDKIEVLEVPKSEFLTRKIAVLSLLDNIVYQAISNYSYLGLIYNNILNKEICFNPEVDLTQQAFLNKYSPYYNSYINAQMEYFNDGYVWRHFIDIEKFYDNINLESLVTTVSNVLGDSSDRDLIINFLKSLFLKCKESGIGLPQGPESSIIFATIYLKEFDQFLYELTKQYDIKVLRYQDDIVLMSKNESTAKEVGRKVIDNLKSLKLNPNSKTDLNKIDSVSILREKILKTSHPDDIGDFTNLPSTKSIKDTISKILRRNQVKDSQIRDLKYFLKVDKTISDSLAEVVYLYDKLPQVSVSITRYIFNRFDINREFINDLNDNFRKLNITSIQLFSKIWLLRSLIFINKSKNSSLIDLIFDSENHWLLNVIKIGLNGQNIKYIDLAKDTTHYELIAYGSVISDIDDKSKLIVNNISNKSNKDLSLFLWVLAKQSSIKYPHVKPDFLKFLDNEYIEENKNKKGHIKSITFNTHTYIENLNVFDPNYSITPNLPQSSSNQEYHPILNKLNEVNSKKFEPPLVVIDFENLKVSVFPDNKTEEEPFIFNNKMKKYIYIKFLIQFEDLQIGTKITNRLKYVQDFIKPNKKEDEGIDTKERFGNYISQVNRKYKFKIFSFDGNGDCFLQAKILVIGEK